MRIKKRSSLFSVIPHWIIMYCMVKVPFYLVLGISCDTLGNNCLEHA